MADGSTSRRALVAVLLVGLVAAVVAIVVVATRHDSHPTARGTASVRPSSSAPGTPPSGAAADPSTGLPVGVTFGNSLFGLTPARLGRALDDVVDLHMHWIRVDVSWNSLQPQSAGRFDWAPLDAIVAAAHSRRLTVLGLLSYTPAWARADGCRLFTCPPRSAAQFARFAAAVATRYRGQGLRNFQIWNEPNINLFWTSPDPLRYRALLAATVTALRATGSGLRILFGGLAVAGDTGGDLPAARFLNDVCAGRAAACRVDAVGYDPYTYPALPSSTRTPLNAVQQLISPTAGTNSLRAALVATGLRRTPVWITGFGAPTRQSGSNDPGAVSRATQSRILTDGLRVARAQTGVVGGYFVDTLRDSTAGGPSRNHFGIEDADGSRKPAFDALARALGG